MRESSARILRYTGGPSMATLTAGQIMKREFALTDRQISRLKFRSNGIMLNGRRCRTTAPVKEGDILEICLDDPPAENGRYPCGTTEESPGSASDLQILYEDPDLLIVSKPAGMAVHRGRGHYGDTLSDLVSIYLDISSGIHSIGRLDKDTSGVVVFAKNAVCAQKLQEQRNHGTFRKIYLAVAHGYVGEPGKEFVIDCPIVRDSNALNRMKTVEKRPGDNLHSMSAVTHVRILSANKLYSSLRIWLETGRTHQIRVHMASLGHPLVGDPIYGTEYNVSGQSSSGSDSDARGNIFPRRAALHCVQAELIQPFSNKKIRVESPLPEDMKSFMF